MEILRELIRLLRIQMLCLPFPDVSVLRNLNANANVYAVLKPSRSESADWSDLQPIIIADTAKISLKSQRQTDIRLRS